MTPQERVVLDGLTDRDLRQMLRDIPFAIIGVLAIAAFCILVFTAAPVPQ